MRRTNYKKIVEEAEEVNSSISSFAKSNKIPNEYFEFVPVEAHPAVVSACRKLRILLPHFKRLASDIQTGINSLRRHNTTLSKDYGNGELASSYHYTLVAVGMWNPHTPKQSVVLYPNLWSAPQSIGNFDEYSYKRENPLFPVITARLHQRIKTDIDAKRTDAWFPFHRGIKRLGSNHVSSLSGYLAKALRFKGNQLTAIHGGAQIIDAISAKVLELYQPTEFEFADDITSMREMYRQESSETPTSCMDSNHNFGLRYYVPNDMKEAKAEPVDFYAHCPITRGAYIKRGSTVLARTICWHDTLADKWYYGRVYANRSAYSSTLVERLREEGYRELSGEREMFPGRKGHDYLDPLKSIDSFTIPYSHNSNGYNCCVMPYFDRMPFYSLMLTKNEDKKEFTCYINHTSTFGKGDLSPDLRGTCGTFYPEYDDGAEYSECDQCGDESDWDDALHVNDYHFCGTDCAQEYGMVVFVQSENSRWVNSNDMDSELRNGVPAFGQNVYFSNHRAACNNQSAAVYRPSMFAETETDFFIYLRRVALPWVNRGVVCRHFVGYCGNGQTYRQNLRNVILADQKAPSEDNEVRMQVVSNMASDATWAHHHMMPPVNTVRCNQHIVDNLHVKSSYEFISSIQYNSDTQGNIFDYDIEKEDEALFNTFSQHLGNLPKLMLGELPTLIPFVTFNQGDNQ